MAHYYGYEWPNKPGVLYGSQCQTLVAFDTFQERAEWINVDPVHRTTCLAYEARDWMISNLEATHPHARQWNTNRLLTIWRQEQEQQS